MRTVRRLLWRDVAASVAFVAAAFLGLFLFIDVVEEIDDLGRRGRDIGHVVLAALYQLPGHLYELMPIAVLIGTIYALARMAQASEFTILRTGGLGPVRALLLLAGIGALFAGFTFAVGDYVAPAAERRAALLRARFNGGLQIGRAGAWLKDKRAAADGEHSVSINLGGAAGNGRLDGIRIFEFDAAGRLVERIAARSGRVGGDGTWSLADARVTRWPADADAAAAAVRDERVPSLSWPSALTPAVVAAAVLPLATMTTAELWRYSEHLSGQAQATQSHRIRFWKKALYPFACLVMVALALPFAYLHAARGGIGWKVFGGILLGISFVLLNNLAGHVGLLRDWSPWVAAATPGLAYLALSLAAFAWLVRYR